MTTQETSGEGIQPQTGAAQLKSAARQPRPIFIMFAVLFAVTAIIVDMITHIGDVRFDPMPNYLYLIAYISGVLTLIVNQWVLNGLRMDRDTLWRTEERSLSIAAIATGSGMVTAGVTATMFVPVIPLAIEGIFFYGISLLAFAPLTGFIAVISQFVALIEQVRRLPITKQRRIGQLFLASASFTLFILVLQPLCVGLLIGRCIHGDSDIKQSVHWIRAFGGTTDLLRACYRQVLPPWVRCGVFGTYIDSRELQWSDDEVIRARKAYRLITGTSYTAEKVLDKGVGQDADMEAASRN